MVCNSFAGNCWIGFTARYGYEQWMGQRDYDRRRIAGHQEGFGRPRLF